MEIIDGAGGRRQWSADERARTREETQASGLIVSEVARRHILRPQQVFGWRWEAYIEPKGAPLLPAFVPEVVEAQPRGPVAASTGPKRHRRLARQPVVGIELEIDDVAVRVVSGTNADTITVSNDQENWV